MTSEDFDLWRANYDESSVAQQRAFYSRVFRDHPVQRHGHFEWCLQLQSFVFRERATVAELGGWDGHLAELVLRERPDITCWRNFEICPDLTPIADERYRLIVCEEWAWKRKIACDTLVMSHVLEHMRAANFHELLTNLSASCLWIESPLQPTFLQDWNGYGGTHIFEYGWDFVSGCLRHFGFECVFSRGDVRLYGRQDS